MRHILQIHSYLFSPKVVIPYYKIFIQCLFISLTFFNSSFSSTKKQILSNKVKEPLISINEKFKNLDSIENIIPDYFDKIKYIGELESKEKIYHLVSAIPCKKCNMHRAIFLLSKDKVFEFTHPGRIFDEKGKLIHHSNAYFGKCLKTRENPVIVFFQKEKIPKWKYLQSSVFVAEIHPDGIKEKLIIRRSHRPRERNVRKEVNNKNCFKIAKISRKVFKNILPKELPKP